MLSAKLKEAAGNGIDSTLYVDDVFSTWLYTGNGSTQTITNGIDLAGKGGLVWIKSRSAPAYNCLFDTARGANNVLWSNTTNAQVTYPSPFALTAFNSNGFNLNAEPDVNQNTTTYASWTFRKAAKFFDVVTYTGTGSARTIAHSLGVAPGMVIVKRTDTTGNWQVYSNGLTSAAYSIQLNLTNAQASATTVWNSTAPTSSVFSVGTDATVNASGGTYVAYLFAHDTSSTGIIQCGSFTTDASGNATVNLGWEPQYLILKYSSGIDGWKIFDSMRGWKADGSNARLYADLSNAESTDVNPKLNSSGFSLGSLGPSLTYIYMAIRRPNKPPTSGTQVFMPVLSTNDSVFNTIGFSVDLLLDASRGAGMTARSFLSRLQGGDKYLLTSQTDAETSSGITTTFQSNTAVAPGLWGAGSNLVLEAFKRAPGFFDVVCYTGTGSATTQAHNLTVVPELMIVKERSAVNDWWVYSVTVGNTKYSVLNSTAVPVTSSTAWNNTTPTSSVFSIGTGANVNASTQTYVAYLFATLAGISKVGSYTGNGTTQTINCGFTGGARFVLIKRTDSTGDWYVFDTARGMTTLTDPYLLLNSTAAEVATLGAVTSVTTGFAVNAAIVAAINTNAASYIFLAIA